jgi:hypothetical protein
MMRKFRRFFASSSTQANDAIDEASSKLGAIQASLDTEVECLRQKQGLERRMLQQIVTRGSCVEIMAQTKRVNETTGALKNKVDLRESMRKQQEQLKSAIMNTNMASAFQSSLDAQKGLNNTLPCGQDIDGLLDAAEDLGDVTADVSSRFAAGADATSCLTESPEDVFDMDEVRRALGAGGRTHPAASEVSQLVAEQPTFPTVPRRETTQVQFQIQ